LRVIEDGWGHERIVSTSIGPICRQVNLYLDGLLLSKNAGVPLPDIDQFVPVEWVEAIEVYRRPSEIPAEFLGNAACGVVAIWTRRGE
jgi:hypothetical protein